MSERRPSVISEIASKGRDLAFAVRAYTEMGLHYGGIFMRLLSSKRRQSVEELPPMNLGSFRDRQQREK